MIKSGAGRHTETFLVRISAERVQSGCQRWLWNWMCAPWEILPSPLGGRSLRLNGAGDSVIDTEKKTRKGADGSCSGGDSWWSSQGELVLMVVASSESSPADLPFPHHPGWSLPGTQLPMAVRRTQELLLTECLQGKAFCYSLYRSNLVELPPNIYEVGSITPPLLPAI